MSHRACGFCDDALEQAEKIKESGYAYTGGESALSVTEVYAKDEVTGVFPLDADISQQASKILNGSGGQVFVADAKVSRSRVEVGLRNGQWVVVTIAPIPEN